MVLSAPTILRPRVRISSTPSTLFQLLKLYRENNENKQKEAGIGPFKKTILKATIEIVVYQFREIMLQCMRLQALDKTTWFLFIDGLTSAD